MTTEAKHHKYYKCAYCWWKESYSIRICTNHYVSYCNDCNHKLIIDNKK
jgi:DNA-directed RNA polymerase subunit RPC12/RpoP